MKIAVISDIHGNLPALEAVLDDLPSAADILCLGDIVGYNPWPEECVNLVRKRCDHVVQGNHDREINNPEYYSQNSMAEAGLEFPDEQVSQDNRKWLESLPAQKEILDGDFLISHSHPGMLDAYVFPSEYPVMDRFLMDKPWQFLAMGHTHVPGSEFVEDCLVFNPGSIGQPRDSDKRASYAILDTDNVEVEIIRVEYDTERTQQRILDLGLPKRTAERLS